MVIYTDNISARAIALLTSLDSEDDLRKKPQV